MFYPKKRTVVKERKAAGSEKLKIKTITVYDKWDRKGIFHLLLIILILIPVGLFMYYVYYSDNQAQGRYIMPALYPAMYFVTAGWNRLLERFVKKENIRMWIYRVLTALLAASSVFMLYLPGSSVLWLTPRWRDGKKKNSLTMYPDMTGT